MKTLVDKVATAWPTYHAEFIANTKTNSEARSVIG